MYLTNCSPRALIGAFSVTTEVAMKDQQTLRRLFPVVDQIQPIIGISRFRISGWLTVVLTSQAGP